MTYKPRSYKDFVKYQAERNPCLLPLARLLEQEKPPASRPSAIYFIDCEEDPGTLTNARRSSLESVVADIERWKSSSGSMSSLSSFRKIIFVEDVDTHALQSLGACLDIDPLFFANYLFTELRNIESHLAPPAIALLPSKLADHDCIHLHYQDILDLGTSTSMSGNFYKYSSTGNVKRLMRCLPALPGVQPGILRGCCSAILKRFDGNSWISLILIDPVPTKMVPSTKSPFASSQTPVPLDFKPFQAGSEDFLACGSFSDWSTSDHKPLPSKKSILQTLFWYYKQMPPGLDIRNPSFLSLIYYPLREISSRWMLYILLFGRYSKLQEYSVEKRMNKTLETDIIEIQRWRRRAQQSVNKINLAMKFILLNTPKKDPQEQSLPADTRLDEICASLLGDYEHLVAELKAHISSMEFIISMATAMVQFTVARQSTLESINIRRLSYIILVFAPLGFVASIFSMSDEFIPGHFKFWIYVVSSAAIVLLVVAISLAIDSSFRIKKLIWKEMAGRILQQRGKSF